MICSMTYNSLSLVSTPWTSIKEMESLTCGILMKAQSNKLKVALFLILELRKGEVRITLILPQTINSQSLKRCLHKSP